MICVNCGTNLDEGVKFCPQCGTKAGDMAANPAEAAEPVQPAQPVSETPWTDSLPPAEPPEAQPESVQPAPDGTPEPDKLTGQNRKLVLDLPPKRIIIIGAAAGAVVVLLVLWFAVIRGNLANYYGRKGDEEYQDGCYCSAIDSYSMAIMLDSKNAKWYIGRGKAYSIYNPYGGGSNFDDAIKDFTRAIELEPENAEYYAIRGWYEDYTKAIELDPGNEEYYLERIRRSNDTDQKIKDYSTLIELNPENADYYAKRGNLYYSKKNYDRAIEDFTSAIVFDQGNAEYYLWRGNAYIERANNYLSVNRNADYNRGDADHARYERLSR